MKILPMKVMGYLKLKVKLIWVQGLKTVGMNVTQDQSPCFNKLLPICSTSKNTKVQLSEISIQMPSPIEISHSENAVSVNIVTSLPRPLINIQNISDKSTNILYPNQKNGRPKKKVLNWHHLHQKLLVCNNYEDLSYILYQIHPKHSLVNLLLKMTGLTIQHFIMYPGTFHKCFFFTIQ